MLSTEWKTWHQIGQIYLWYVRGNERNFPGWHCALDESCRVSLVELCDLMLATQENASRVIAVSSPSEEVARLPGSADGSKSVTPSRIRVSYPQTEVAANHWRWSGDLTNPTLTIGKAKLIDLRSAIETSREFGDFCIHADDQKLHGFDFERMSIWFWPA